MTQDEANHLIFTEKIFQNEIITWPMHKSKSSFPLKSKNEDKNDFILDINNFGRIELRSLTIQNRYTKEIILVRADFGNKKHTNPDHTIVSGNHVHIYLEGSNDGWAYEINAIPDLYLQGKKLFMSLDNDISLFDSFCNLCNIEIPKINLTML